MTRLCIKTVLGLTIVIAGAALGRAAAADLEKPAVANAPAVKTGKERLTDKASDEQRVDDCKVAQARRTRPRPTNCATGDGG
jgi:hypothetical protein